MQWRSVVRISIITLFLTALIPSKFAFATDSFEDLADSVFSKEFTQSEKKFFIDSTDLFQKYELQNNIKVRSIIAWADNDHIVFSARKLPSWEAKPMEPSRIVSMNIVTGEYSDSGYRGRLLCLNHLGDMLVRLGGDEEITSLSSEKYEWLSGRWGENLYPIDRPSSSFIPNYLCRFSPYVNLQNKNQTDPSSEKIKQEIPLLPEHGHLIEKIKYTNNSERHPVYLIKPDGNSFQVSEKIPSHADFYFNPWMNTYFEKSPLRYHPRTFSPSGEFSQISIPRLLAYWSERNSSMSAGGVLTKAGMLWDVHQGYGDWKKQGLYLDTTEGLLRVEVGRGTNATVSPNGCRVIDSVIRENPYGKLPHIYTWLVIDLCKTKK